MYDEGQTIQRRNFTGEVSISQKSAATAVFTLGSATTAEGLWLELRKSPGKTVFPAGTKLTLLGLIGFYSYITTGTETKIALTDFTGMWNSSHPAGNITRETQLTVIMDFGAVESLANGDYSLRLRSNTGADSNGADFTVNNSDARLGMSGIGGYSRGEHAVTLTVSPDSDTRFADGAVAVLARKRQCISGRCGVYLRRKDILSERRQGLCSP